MELGSLRYYSGKWRVGNWGPARRSPSAGIASGVWTPLGMPRRWRASGLCRAGWYPDTLHTVDPGPCYMEHPQQVTGPGKLPEEEQSVPAAVSTVTPGPKWEQAPSRRGLEDRKPHRKPHRSARGGGARGAPWLSAAPTFDVSPTEGSRPEAPQKVLLRPWGSAEGGTCLRGTPGGVAGARGRLGPPGAWRAIGGASETLSP